MDPLALFRSCYCLSLAFAVACKHSEQRRYLALVHSVEPTVSLIGIWRMPRLSVREFNAAGFALTVALIGVSAGMQVRILALAAIALYFLYFSQIVSLAYVARKTSLVPKILLLLLVSGTVHYGSVDDEGWTLWFIQALVTQVYLSAGVNKVRRSGLAWMSGRQLQGALLFEDMYHDLPYSRAIARHRNVCALLACLILSHQLTFWCVLVFPSLAIPYATVGIAFHLASLPLLRINYMLYQGPAYFAFVVPSITPAVSTYALP